MKPVTPTPLPAAAELLSLLHGIRGRFVLSGQHNQPMHGSAWTERITALTGSEPAVWGGEIGFSAAGTLDGVDRRPATIAEAVRAHGRGAVIVITWHAVCPLDDEPVTFDGGILRSFDPADFDVLFDPTSTLHGRWAAQVDVAAGFLRELQDAGVPVIWRPYHEMNGPWFWWGGQPARSRALWRLLFSRLVDHHGLVNLLWLWNPNAPYGSAGPIEDHYPGHNVVDLLGVDVYGSRYDQRFHDQLLALAGGRPIALGEVGGLPGPRVLDAQPGWCWYMAWPEQVIAENPEGLAGTTTDPRVLDLPGLRSLRWPGSAEASGAAPCPGSAGLTAGTGRPQPYPSPIAGPPVSVVRDTPAEEPS